MPRSLGHEPPNPPAESSRTPRLLLVVPKLSHPWWGTKKNGPPLELPICFFFASTWLWNKRNELVLKKKQKQPTELGNLATHPLPRSLSVPDTLLMVFQQTNQWMNSTSLAYGHLPHKGERIRSLMLCFLRFPGFPNRTIGEIECSQ